MKSILYLGIFLTLSATILKAQTSKDTTKLATDSTYIIQQLLLKQQEQVKFDSIIKAEIKNELLNTNVTAKEKIELEKKLQQIHIKDSLNKTAQLAKINLLKKTAVGYPVILFKDTLFTIFTRIGSFNAKARAEAINVRLLKLYNDPFFNQDSLFVTSNETTMDVVYKPDLVILSVTEIDALWNNTNNNDLATQYKQQITKSLLFYKNQNSVTNLLKRIGQIALIILFLGLIIFFINKLFKKSKQYLVKNQDVFLNGLTIRNFKVFTADSHRLFAFKLNNAVRVLVIILVIYLSLPLMFSVFPETKIYTDTLLGWIITPAKRISLSLLHFIPNLITIFVIYYITKWAIRGIQYFFLEIETGNINLGGFHKDWAKPTFSILKFILYAFMVVVIFPYLPGSDSAAFQGVSVFLGVLFSLGSSSAITNMIAGLVITYMRPFKIGDRVKIGDVVGDVIEKTMLVTRIRTIKNEEITVPNATVLSSSTINYSSNAEDKGLIMHTTVTIGYDVPWKKIHQALIDAATRTNLLLNDPKPFVLQTSLDDFYVAYQINAYTREPNKQAGIYSELHQNIQDCCNEQGIEILSPHYRAARDGNMITIPENYLSKDYKAPSFNVNVTNNNQK